MFELIGMAVVAWVIWSIAKAIFRGAMRGQMLKTSDYAITLGVPVSFATAMSKEVKALKDARNHLAKSIPDFKTLDVHKQFGHAIHAIYIASITPNEADSAAIREKVKSILKPQIELLMSENTSIALNEVSYAYVHTLATVFSKHSLDLGFVRPVLKEMLPGEQHGIVIDCVFESTETDSQFTDYCKDLLPVVQSEIERGTGEYFVKHVRKLNKDCEEMCSEGFDFDSRDFSKESMLKV